LITEPITHLTFDCYGTLIDWEKGILAAVTPFFERVGSPIPAEAVLRSFVAHEARLEATGWRSYREILRGVLAGMAADLNLRISESELNLLSDSLPDWPPFPDTVSSLQTLAKRFRLAILSNTDDALFAETQKRLAVRFDEIITAEQLNSYKPGRAHFHEALRRLNVPVSQVLHVAQSLYHDHVPAQELGFRTAWINRPSLLAGTGLAPPVQVKPTLIFSDLAGLAARATKGPLLPS
jgi:2-haloacid dehalogenase